jgi:hypothetical protein
MMSERLVVKLVLQTDIPQQERVVFVIARRESRFGRLDGSD